MPVTTTQEFLAICRKSKLLDDEQLAETEKWTEQTDDPKRMAATLAKREWVTRWQAHQLLNGRSTFSMGKYNLIELLGRRGMGNVFLAQHATMNRLVALKIVSKKIGRDPQLLKRFLDEARAIATLDHENIVRAYSVDKEGDCYYIVMEYVEGKNLEDLVQHGEPLDSATAAGYIQQAAEGLAHAHEKGLIHGDVKPASLVVDADGDVKILDVGMSEFTFGVIDESGEQKDLEPKAVNYLAPELCGGEPKPDPRSDIYSLGCTLHFLLTGKPPFPEGTALERMEKHRNETPESILKTRPEVSKNLAKVCRKMMSKNPTDRFRSASVVQRVLSEIVQMEKASDRKSVEQASPPPPRAAAPPADKGNGQPSPEKKSPAKAGKPKATIAAAGSTDAGSTDAGAAKPAAAPQKKKSGGPDFNFLGAAAAGTAAAAPAIQVGKKRKKKTATSAAAAPATAAAAPTPAKKTPAAPAAAEAAAPAPAAKPKRGGKKGKLKWLIIGGAAALALLLLGVAVPGAMWALGWFGGDSEQVAEDDAAEAEDETTASDDEGASRDDEGGIAGRDDEGGIAGRDDEGGVSGTDDEPDSAEGGDDTAMASAAGVDPTVDTDVGSTDGADTTASDSTPDGAADAAAGGTGEEPPADGTADNAAPSESPAPADDTEEPQPAEEPPEEKPAPAEEPKKDPPKPPPKPKDPFVNTKPTATLLAADAEGGANPQPLAAVDVAEDAIWFVSLVGAEDVGKGKRLKVNSNGEDGHKARWTMELESPAIGRREASSAQVADIWYENGNLVFQWNKEGENVPDGALQCCLVQIDVESDSRTVGFFEPQMAEPLAMMMNKKATATKIELDKMPNPDKLKFEITRLEGIKDKMALEPNGPVPVRTPVNIQIMLTDAYNNVVPGIVFQANLTANPKNLTISHRLTGSVADHPMVGQMRLGFPLPPDGRNMVEGKITELEESMKGKKGQGLRGEERAKVQQGIQFGGMVVWFDDFVKNPAGPGKIHYRIFMDIGGRQIDVIRTEDPKAAGAEPNKGAGKGPAKKP